MKLKHDPGLQELLTMSLMTVRGRRHLVLCGIDWRTYTRLLYAFAEHPSVRLTYDRGDLEIMSPLPEHESDARMLGRFVVVMTEELGLPIKGGGSTTFRRRRKQRGLEPDDSYWIATEPRVRGKRRIDLRIDPPPDLAIEVDVTSSSLDRMAIYASLAVPEVWRLDDSVLTFHVLEADRRFAKSLHSLAFPLVTPSDLIGFMSLRSTLDENTVVRQFREWFRKLLAATGSLP
jgi:Uma2 family endonuclease